MLLILALLFSIPVAIFSAEFILHQRRLAQIPIRIHVNGTRGKSSVTRLIAAALKAHNLRVFAKTTGTLPKMIFPDGSELPVYRPSKANIIEQLRIVSLAASRRAEVLVLECMALQPHLQSLCELKLVRATHGVITNARADHLDVMGPHEADVARALLGTTPLRAKLFTAERDYLPLFEESCRDRESVLVPVMESDLETVSDEEMSHFDYVEHKENVALALKVSASIGVPREVALKGMYSVSADVGALTEYRLSYFGRELIFVNGFAANDPESTEMIWNLARARHPGVGSRVMIINCRADRPDRSQQLGESLSKWHPADHYVLIGSGAYTLMKTAVGAGVSPSTLVYAEKLRCADIFELLLGVAAQRSLLIGVGNIKGPGLELIQFFKNRSSRIAL